MARFTVTAKGTLRVDLADLLDFSQAGKVLGLTRPQIYNLVREHKLTPMLVQRRKVFCREDVLRLKKARVKQGGSGARQ